MSQDWLVAMGVDVRHPMGMDGRSLVGHRLLLALRQRPMTCREMHALLGRKVPAAQRRRALSELEAAGLVEAHVSASGSRGGRPTEAWVLLYPGSSAVRCAEQVVQASGKGRNPGGGELPSVAQPSEMVHAGARAAPRRSPRRSRHRKAVPGDVAEEVCEWIASGRFLRDYCRRPGRPAARTVYAWTAKDPAFRVRFRRARDCGEAAIRDDYMELLENKALLDSASVGRGARREFYRRFVRPIDLRLQRWRRHPRRGGVRRG